MIYSKLPYENVLDLLSYKESDDIVRYDNSHPELLQSYKGREKNRAHCMYSERINCAYCNLDRFVYFTLGYGGIIWFYDEYDKNIVKMTYCTLCKKTQCLSCDKTPIERICNSCINENIHKLGQIAIDIYQKEGNTRFLRMTDYQKSEIKKRWWYRSYMLA
jgi:hypothetical protein